MSEQYKDIEKDVLARTLWGEARGEGEQGMHAVANVIVNRVAISQEKGTFWWGNNIIGVCQKPWQFSCWNSSDPNFEKLKQGEIPGEAFRTARRLAEMACEGCLADITSGATHYHAVGISPYWAKREKPVEVIGKHIFYRIL